MKVAVIGASRDRRKFGNKAVRAFRRRGYEVLPVNARAGGAGSEADQRIEGLPVHASVLDAPGPIDLATLYVPPAIGETLVDEIAAKGIPALWVNPGAESQRLVERARALGIETTLHCSIVAIGESPADYDDRPDPSSPGRGWHRCRGAKRGLTRSRRMPMLSLHAASTESSSLALRISHALTLTIASRG